MTGARGGSLHDGALAGSGRVVFVSYSREDAGWMERFVKMLEPERRGLGLEVWVDTAIATGREWRGDMEAAIARADVALLLVSSDFLASSFIVEQELPALVARKVPLACALLRTCRYAAVDDLERVQWAHDPVRDGPIAMASDVDAAIADVVAALVGMLNDARPAAIARTGQPERGERVRFNLPPVAPSFTGREEELAELDVKLDHDDRALITQAIRAWAVSARVSSQPATRARDAVRMTSWRGLAPRTAGSPICRASLSVWACESTSSRRAIAPVPRWTGLRAVIDAGCWCSTTSSAPSNCRACCHAVSTAGCS
jgi:TIR domain-containing protein